MRGPARAVALLALLSGCAYHNVLHNATQLFEEGETLRRAGLDTLAAARYEDVTRKTGQAYLARPQSEWACDALILLGRAHHRLGDLRAARAALEEADRNAGPCVSRADVGVYLAAVSVEMGDGDRALGRLNTALETTLPPGAAAEAHLLRGALLLERSWIDPGWWDLDRAIALEPGVRAAAGLTGLRWSVAYDDRERGRRAVQRLFTLSEAGVRVDSIVRLTDLAAQRWSAGEAAALLDGVNDADWDRSARGTVALHRARLLHAAGDTAEARRQATEVASGLGDTAAGARMLLSGWRLERAQDLADVMELRRLLLPSGSDARVAARLAAIDALEGYADAGLDEPLGWFGAAEIARDRLGAPYVARGLMLAYADAGTQDPWVAKALLAAMDLSREVGDRAWIRGRLEAHRDNPYVLAALGGSAAGFEALEQELDVRLQELSQR